MKGNGHPRIALDAIKLLPGADGAVQLDTRPWTPTMRAEVRHRCNHDSAGRRHIGQGDRLVTVDDLVDAVGPIDSQPGTGPARRASRRPCGHDGSLTGSRTSTGRTRSVRSW